MSKRYDLISWTRRSQTTKNSLRARNRSGSMYGIVNTSSQDRKGFRRFASMIQSAIAVPMPGTSHSITKDASFRFSFTDLKTGLCKSKKESYSKCYVSGRKKFSLRSFSCSNVGSKATTTWPQSEEGEERSQRNAKIRLFVIRVISLNVALLKPTFFDSRAILLIKSTFKYFSIIV